MKVQHRLDLHNFTSTGLWDVSQTYYHNVSTSTLFASQRVEQQYEMPTSINHKFPYGISLGSINKKWFHYDKPRLNWFPIVRYEPIPFHQNNIEVYTLPSSVVMVPFHSLAAVNPGHMMWDDFLPIYTLLQLFGLAGGDTNNSNNDGDETSDLGPADLLLLRYVLPPTKGGIKVGVWGGCDYNPKRSKTCAFMLKKFSNLMLRNPEQVQISTQLEPQVDFTDSASSDNNKKKLICAKNGLAGLGSLSDHGVDKGHGWEWM